MGKLDDEIAARLKSASEGAAYGLLGASYVVAQDIHNDTRELCLELAQRLGRGAGVAGIWVDGPSGVRTFHPWPPRRGWAKRSEYSRRLREVAALNPKPARLFAFGWTTDMDSRFVYVRTEIGPWVPADPQDVHAQGTFNRWSSFHSYGSVIDCAMGSRVLDQGFLFGN